MKKYILLLLFFINFAIGFQNGHLHIETGIQIKAQNNGEIDATDWKIEDWINFLSSDLVSELGIETGLISVSDLIHELGVDSDEMNELYDNSIAFRESYLCYACHIDYKDGGLTEFSYKVDDIWIKVQDLDHDGVYDHKTIYDSNKDQIYEGPILDDYSDPSNQLTDDDDFRSWYRENNGWIVPVAVTNDVINDYLDDLYDEHDSGIINDTYFESQNELIANTMLNERVLTIAQIKTIRESIDNISDVNTQKKLYAQLQYKVPYYNQRDNKSIQDEVGSVIPKGHKAADVMCNLTSEAANLSALGIDNPNPKKQFEDNLENIKREQDASRTTPDARLYIANKLDATMERYDFKHPTKEVYIAKLQPLLEKGYGIQVGFGGHIVRVVGITKVGLIVDDPMGKLVDFAKRAHISVDTYYNSDKNSQTSSEEADGGQKGKHNLWPWSVLEKYPLAYYEFYYKK